MADQTRVSKADPRSGPLGREPGGAPNDATTRWRAVLLAAGLGAVLLCLVVLGLLASIVSRQEADAVDTAVGPFVHGLASPTLDAVMNAASFVGSDPSLIAIAIVAAVVLVRAGRRREAAFVGTALAGSIGVNVLMKLFFHRPRPALAWAHVLPDYSFPSGHSMNSLTLGLALALVAWRLAGPRAGLASIVAAVGVAVVIGTSRIYLGYHYLTDVVGGFASAVLWVAIVVAVFRVHAISFGSRSRRAADSP